MHKETSSGDFAVGFFLGAFVGAVLALLFAPAPGEEVRSQIREKSIELKDRAEDLSHEASRRADELRVRGQSVLEEQKARFQEAVDEGKEAAARRKEELMAQFEASRTTGTPPSAQA
jgi:gas vesicle protein